MFRTNRDTKTMLLQQCMTLRLFQIVGNHFSTHFLNGDFRDPAEFFLGFGRITQQGFDLGGAEVAGVDADDDITRF